MCDREHRYKPKVMGAIGHDLSKHLEIVISDATAPGAERFENALGRPVREITPSGVPEYVSTIRQVPEDIMRMSNAEKVRATLLTVLLEACSQGLERLGVVSHKRFRYSINGGPAKTVSFRDIVKSLPTEAQKLVAMYDNFGGRLSRGSNTWIEKCDGLICLGTPRPSRDQMMEMLCQLGHPNVLELEPRWMGKSGRVSDYGIFWLGKYENGEYRVVRTTGYADHRRQLAYRLLVDAELIQVMGRCRATLSEGIPGYLVSTHEFRGAILHDLLLPSMGDREVRTLVHVANNEPVFASDLSRLLGLNKPHDTINRWRERGVLEEDDAIPTERSVGRPARPLKLTTAARKRLKPLVVR